MMVKSLPVIPSRTSLDVVLADYQLLTSEVLYSHVAKLLKMFLREL